MAQAEEVPPPMSPGVVVQKYSRHSDPRVLSEEEEAITIFKPLYFWVSGVLSRGSERASKNEEMTLEDLCKIHPDERVDATYERFKEEWAKEIAATKDTPQGPNLFATLKRCFMGPAYIGAVFRFFSDACMVANPFCLREFIKWLALYVFKPKEQQLWVGYVWGLGIAAIMLVQTICMNASMFYTGNAFIRMRTVTQLAIFDKTLNLPGGHGMTGIITSMHATDTSKFFEIGFFYHNLWSAPIVIIAALICLYFFIGWAGVMSILVIIVLLPIQGVIGAKLGAARNDAAKCGDKRLGLINEVIQAIRIVKFMNWEEEFLRRVHDFREAELEVFGSVLKIRSLFVVFITWAPSFITFCVFAIAYGLGNDLNAEGVFPTIAMLGILRLPLSMLPLTVARIIDLNVALGRITNFLLTPEGKPFIVFDEAQAEAIKIHQCTVQYLFTPPPPEADPNARGPPPPPPKPEAKDLMTVENLSIPKGKLTLVVGPTAGGKSTLVSMLVGEALVKEGSLVTATAPMALVAQEAWIMNATVRDNILMGVPWDSQRYLDAVNACELMADFHQLDASDQTEIGERGINLSGGQKQRVAFARAVYSGRDIVVMDDPLSAVDPHVCRDLFEGCICEALAGKTRVLVTHQTQFLPAADHVIVVANRKILFQGTYEALLESGIDVSSLENKSLTSINDAETADYVASTISNTKAPAKSPGMTPPASPVAEQDAAAARLARRGRSIPKPKNQETEGAHLIKKEGVGVGAVPGHVYAYYFKSFGIFLAIMTIFWFTVWRAVQAFSDLILSWWSTRTKIIGYTLTSEQYLYWFAIFIGITFVLILFRQVPFVIGSLNVSENTHMAMFKSVLHAPSSFFDTTPVGRILNRFSKDTEMLDLVIPESLNFFLNLVLVILGAFGVMCYGTPWLSIAIAVLIIIYCVIFVYFQQTNRAVKRLDLTNRSPVLSVMNEILGGLPTIRSYQMRHHFGVVHTHRVDNSLAPMYTWTYLQRWLGVRTDFTSTLVTLATALITVALITNLSFKDQLEALPVMALGITYAMTISGAIGFLTTMTTELESNLASLERIKEYTDSIPQERSITYSTDPHGVPPPDASWPREAKLEFRNVNLRYREGLPLVLKDVSFSVKGGEKVGVVGRTGSGKSTVMLSLFRMIELADENPGQILLDGRDIATLTMSDLRKKITIIPQDPTLFVGTVRGNLDPFQQRTDAEVWTALEKCGMKDRVARVEGGLDAAVADKGGNFSVGERQLLCLARAMLKNCKLLLLDEATASIDPHQDAILQETIRREFATSTVLTIAHRIGTIIDSDKVLVLDHGVVAEFGLPADLIDNKDGVFHSMVEKLGPEKSAELKALAEQHRAEVKKREAAASA